MNVDIRNWSENDLKRRKKDLERNSCSACRVLICTQMLILHNNKLTLPFEHFSHTITCTGTCNMFSRRHVEFNIAGRQPKIFLCVIQKKFAQVLNANNAKAR